MACSALSSRFKQHLVNLIAVVLDLRQGWIFVQSDLDRFRQRLLAAQHDGVFHRGFRSLLRTFGGMRTRRLQQVGDDVIDARDFLANVFDDGARRAGTQADRGR